ncbi:MAG: hypothetical protein II713_00230 [Clostridia bacterium]|nr:hypothetical protein [Clostridia bacterium]
MEIEILKKQFSALSKRADGGNVFYYSDFLTLSEQSELMKLKLPNAALFGGYELAERKLARFGLPEEFGYEEPLPIVCLKIEPRDEKFSASPSHRDYLGAVMNLGIERDTVGDIVVLPEGAFLFALSRIALFILENLSRAGRSALSVSVVEALPAALSPKLEKIRVNVASERADAVVAAIFRMPRARASALFDAGRVFIGGEELLNGSKPLKDGTSVSVRGFGKFIYDGIDGTSRKGRLFVEASLYKDPK